MTSKSLSTLGTMAAAATLASAAPADAATIIQNFFLSGETTNFSLQQFDPSMGTLQSVLFELRPDVQVEVANPNPVPGIATFSLSASTIFNSSTPGAPSIPNWTKTDNYEQSRLNNPYFFQVSDSLQTTTQTSGLSSFYGLSSFNYSAMNSINILSGTAPTGATVRNTSDAFLRVTYNSIDETPAVPEPSTWAMMILGMGAVGAMMRRRRSNDVEAEPAPAPVAPAPRVQLA